LDAIRLAAHHGRRGSQRLSGGRSGHARGRRTNQEGLAKIPPIPQGTILIQVIAKDFQTFGEKFDVDEEQKTIEITLNPPQPQYSAH
jgi:hypothetical protein